MSDNNSRSILDTEIASGYTVASYLADAESQDRRSIADFVFRRFHERYVTPLHRLDSNSKHGFCTMAISCLMVEALESFWQGWPDTRRRGPGAFCSFFARNEAFQTLCGHVDGFYTGVRCGILHQGETTGGWRVHRKGPLFVEQTRTLNATSFHDAVTAALRDYTNQLRVATWEDVIWQKLRKKMTAVCSNCAGPDRAFYFAYGSNMKAERLEKRIQPVRKIGKAKLSGWRLKFDKASKDGSSKANLESDAEGLVWGVLFEIVSDGLCELDRIEGGYYQTGLRVDVAGCPGVLARTYVSDHLSTDERPYQWYKDLVIEGAIEHQLPREYIAELRQVRAKPKQEPGH